MLNTSAWLELDGRPKYQVRMFHENAETSAATTSDWVVTSGGTIPLPTVVATAVPDSAPRKLSTPAMSTADCGVRTRVATEVAIALAESWKPLVKSNTNPSPITTHRMRRPPLRLGTRSLGSEYNPGQLATSAVGLTPV